jgi:hypothetical protein
MEPTKTGPDAGLMIFVVIWWLGFLIAVAWSARKTGNTTMPKGFRVFMALWAVAMIAYGVFV